MEQIFLSILFWSALGLGISIGIIVMWLCNIIVAVSKYKAQLTDE